MAPRLIAESQPGPISPKIADVAKQSGTAKIPAQTAWRHCASPAIVVAVYPPAVLASNPPSATNSARATECGNWPTIVSAVSPRNSEAAMATTPTRVVITSEPPTITIAPIPTARKPRRSTSFAATSGTSNTAQSLLNSGRPPSPRIARDDAGLESGNFMTKRRGQEWSEESISIMIAGPTNASRFDLRLFEAIQVRFAAHDERTANDGR